MSNRIPKILQINLTSYTLRQGSANEQNTFIRGLNLTLFVKYKNIYRKVFSIQP